MKNRFILPVCLWVSLAAGPAVAQSLCKSPDTQRWSCYLKKNGRTLTLCEGESGLKLRLGTAKKLDWELPETQGAGTVSLYAQNLPSAQTRGIAFTRGDQTYIVAHFVGGRPAVERQYLWVQENGRPYSNQICAVGASPDGRLPDLYERLAATGMSIRHDP